MLATSNDNKKKAFSLEDDDEDDFDSEPWEHKKVSAKQPDRRELQGGGKLNPLDQKVKPTFDDMEDDDDWGAFDNEPKPKKGGAQPAMNPSQKDNQLSLGNLLRH